MPGAPAIENTVIEQWIAEKLDSQKVIDRLVALGYDEEAIAANVQAFKKALCAKRQFTGFIFLGVGAFVGFLSCVTALVNPVPDLFHWFLYGLTSIALLLIFYGLYLLFN
ncbi:MAG TPA: hypothetical protein VFW07_09670 [Parafilimonas sp.]|nr:hypothetical protein [Parafilimonas sp.]